MQASPQHGLGKCPKASRIISRFSCSTRHKRPARYVGVRWIQTALSRHLAPLLACLALVSITASSAPVRAQGAAAQAPVRLQPDLKLNVADLYCVAWSPDGASLASGHRSGFVKLWDARTGALRLTFRIHQYHDVLALAYSKDGTFLATGCEDNNVTLWNAQTGALVRVFKQEGAETSHQDSVTSLSWSPDGKTLASGSKDDTVAVWDAATGTRLFTLSGHGDDVLAVAFAPDGKTLMSGGKDDVKVWDARTGAPQAGLEPVVSDVKDMAWSSDGAIMALAVTPLMIWDTRAHQVLHKDKVPLFSVSPIESVAISPDSSLVATGHSVAALGGCEVRLWDARTLELKQTLRGHKLPVTDLAFSPDSKSIVSASMDGTLKVWPVSGSHSPVTLVSLSGIVDAEGTCWIAMTDEGFFDASPAALQNQKWRIVKDGRPGETVKSDLWRPDVVQRLLQPLPVTPQSPIGVLLAAYSVPPSVAFLTPGDKTKATGETVDVQVAVSDDVGVQQLDFRVNGRPVKVAFSVGATQEITNANRGQVLGGKVIPTTHSVANTYRAAIPLPPGESKILVRAIARDSGGLESSSDLHIERELMARGASIATLPPEAAREAEKLFQGDLHVLTVGVSRYKNPNYNLAYPVADAAAFGTLWPPMKDRLYKNVLTTQLMDDKATAPAVQEALDKLIQTTTNKDTVFIFLAGHGLQINEGEFYFATHEVDFKNPQKTALPWTALTDILAKVPAKRVVLFLDACHSGAALGEARASNERMAETLIKRAGVMVFASSRGDQVSLESAQWKHGAFTKALLEGIAEGKANLDTGEGQDGNITVAKLLVYLQARVPKLTEGQQSPACPLMQDFGEPFRLARTADAK